MRGYIGVKRHRLKEIECKQFNLLQCLNCLIEGDPRASTLNLPLAINNNISIIVCKY